MGNIEATNRNENYTQKPSNIGERTQEKITQQVKNIQEAEKTDTLKDTNAETNLPLLNNACKLIDPKMEVSYQGDGKYALLYPKQDRKGFYGLVNDYDLGLKKLNIESVQNSMLQLLVAYSQKNFTVEIVDEATNLKIKEILDKPEALNTLTTLFLANYEKEKGANSHYLEYKNENESDKKIKGTQSISIRRNYKGDEITIYYNDILSEEAQILSCNKAVWTTRSGKRSYDNMGNLDMKQVVPKSSGEGVMLLAEMEKKLEKRNK